MSPKLILIITSFRIGELALWHYMRTPGGLTLCPGTTGRCILGTPYMGQSVYYSAMSRTWYPAVSHHTFPSSQVSLLARVYLSMIPKVCSTSPAISSRKKEHVSTKHLIRPSQGMFPDTPCDLGDGAEKQWLKLRNCDSNLKIVGVI